MSRVALVTGGSSGIGEAICKVLSDKGITVYGTSRGAQNGETRENFRMVQMDVTEPTSVKDGIDYILSQHSRLDIVVNNAGLGHIGPLESTDQASVKEIFNTNLIGILNVCNNCMPIMRENGGGYIINISSLAGEIGLPFRGIYSSSKYAVEGFTEALRLEAKLSNIKVSIIQPGDIKTNISANRRTVDVPESSVYYTRFKKTVNTVNEEVEHGLAPEKIGQMVAKIVDKKNPKVRYKVGPFGQKLSVSALKFVPNWIIEKILMKDYMSE